MDDVIYCPVCERALFAANALEVEEGEDESYIFIHDNITHSESDMVALGNGIN
jgi:hypothetical protein